MGGGASGKCHGSGSLSTKVNHDKQAKHNIDSRKYTPGKSYLNWSDTKAQEFIDKNMKNAVKISDNKYRVSVDYVVGMHIDQNGNKHPSKNAIIVLSKTGSHIYPGKPGKGGK